FWVGGQIYLCADGAEVADQSAAPDALSGQWLQGALQGRRSFFRGIERNWPRHVVSHRWERCGGIEALLALCIFTRQKHRICGGGLRSPRSAHRISATQIAE